MPERERERDLDGSRQVRRALLLGIAAAVAGCYDNPPPRVVTIVCQDDSGVVEQFAEDQSAEATALSSPCARACKNLAELGCPESAKLPGGKTCVETCKAISPISSYDPECVIKAKTVAAVRKCPATRC